jgi:NADPH-dependent 2,4-dienoyl-CoA reductase/sulfur reductase-like enzyme
VEGRWHIGLSVEKGTRVEFSDLKRPIGPVFPNCHQIHVDVVAGVMLIALPPHLRRTIGVALACKDCAMSVLHVKYLMIGGGLASSTAAQAIRERDPHGSVMVIGQEINRPYHRPPLSKDYLRRETPRDKLGTTEQDWFTANNVELRTGRRVARLATSRNTVTLDNAEEIVFDRLLLATGATPAPLMIPGADLPNVFYVRTIEDVDRLHHAIDKAKNEGQPHPRGRGRAAVIGGGFLGVELAASLTQLGLGVDLIVGSEFPWHKFAGESTGKFLVHYLEKHGVKVHVGQRPQRLDGDGRVQRVVISESLTIPCDFVVPAVGITIPRDLLRGTPIAAEKAILVDDHCRTNVPDIFAAGDCAAVYDPLFGKHRILDHWDNAQVTGKIAGANMAGADVAYNAVNYFFSDVFTLSISAWGEARQVDRRLIRGTPNVDSPDFIEIGIAADGRIAQVLAVGHTGEDDDLRALVARRLQVDGNSERLRDPSILLKEFV